jgi:sigma-E factor negative regulatory protein RseC
MIEESGTIVAVHGDLAEVETRRRSACGSCSATGGCGTSLLEQYFGRKPLLLEAHNPIGAGPGDTVVVGVPEQALVGAAFAAYVVPLAALIGGGILGNLLAGALALGGAQLLSILGGVAGFAVALVWLGRFSRGRASDTRYRAVILRRSSTPAFSVQIPLGSLRDERRSGGA